MPGGRVLRIEPGRRSVQIERRGRTEELGLIAVEADETGVGVVTRPVRLVRHWLAALAAGDRRALLDLYHPTAVVHWAGGLAQGPAAIGEALVDLDLLSSPDPSRAVGATVRAVDRFVIVDRGPGSDLPSLAFMIDTGSDSDSGSDSGVLGSDTGTGPAGTGPAGTEGHGSDTDRRPGPAAIVEQWIGVDPTAEPSAQTEPITLVCRGSVSAAAAEYAREKVARLVAHHLGSSRPGGPGPLIWGQIKLGHTANPADERSSRAELSLDLDGQVIRAHAAAPTMPEAIDEAVERLRSNLARLTDRRHQRAEDPTPTPGHWRHGDRPPASSPWIERPREEREVVRHKSFAPARLSLDDARWDLDLLGYDFFLFTEQSTGIDCVLARTATAITTTAMTTTFPAATATTGQGDRPEPGVVTLHGLADRPDLRERLARPGLLVADRPVPRLRTTEALDLLDATGERFELFENTSTGRRNVVYRRHDGHYGLITPPPPAPEPPPSEEQLIHEGRRQITARQSLPGAG